MKSYELYCVIAFLLSGIYYLFQGVFFTGLLLFMGCFWVFMAKNYRVLATGLRDEVQRFLEPYNHQ